MIEPRYHISTCFGRTKTISGSRTPDLRYCTTHGATREQAIAKAAEVIESWLKSAHDNAVPIPEPRYRPAIYAAKFAA